MAAETDGYARYGFKDDLVFERANKADVVGGEEDGAFADDDDANVDAFVEVNETAPVGKAQRRRKQRRRTRRNRRRRRSEPCQVRHPRALLPNARENKNK